MASTPANGSSFESFSSEPECKNVIRKLIMTLCGDLHGDLQKAKYCHCHPRLAETPSDPRKGPSERIPSLRRKMCKQANETSLPYA